MRIACTEKPRSRFLRVAIGRGGYSEELDRPGASKDLRCSEAAYKKGKNFTSDEGCKHGSIIFIWYIQTSHTGPVITKQSATCISDSKLVSLSALESQNISLLSVIVNTWAFESRATDFFSAGSDLIGIRPENSQMLVYHVASRSPPLLLISFRGWAVWTLQPRSYIYGRNYSDAPTTKVEKIILDKIKVCLDLRAVAVQNS